MDTTNGTSTSLIIPYYVDTENLPSGDSTFWIILFSIIIGLGAFAVVSNLMFLITVIGDSSLRKTKLSVYLIELAIIDIISSTGYILFACLKIMALNPMSEFIFVVILDAFFIIFVLIVRNTFQFLSSVLIICVAWERYKAVCRPFDAMISPGNRKRHVATVVIGTIVLLVLFMCGEAFLLKNFFPVAIHASVRCEDEIVDGIRYCYNDRYLVLSGVPGINYVLLAVDVLTLTISMSVFYFIIRRIKQSPALGVADRHQKEERKLTRMAFFNNLAFVVLVLLQDISTLLVIVLAKSNFPKTGEFVYSLQGIWNLMNSAANPIIYNVFGTLYRRAMVKRFIPCMEGTRGEMAAGHVNAPTATTTF